MAPTLFTIPWSHYCERARWALDWHGIAFEERGYLPILHMPFMFVNVRGQGQGTKHSSRLSTPALKLENGTIIHETLYPEGHREDIRAFCQRVEDVLGPAVRRYAYFYLLDEPQLMREVAKENVGGGQFAFYTVFSGLVRAVLLKALKINARTSAQSLTVIREELDSIEAQLGDKRYLYGDQFTAADLTAAALISPLVAVSRDENYGCTMPSHERYPEPLRSLCEETRNRPLGQYILRLYKDHRVRNHGAAQPIRGKL